jgi:8-oxo-dGTP pyrophosphatase MutT (NUDIX family)
VIDALRAGRRGTPRADVVAPPQSLVPAAVLVPLVSHPQGLSVLLTQRTPHLLHHAGQISFPGGRIEQEDESAEAAALREAQEEIGLPPDSVDLLGRLDDYVTVTGFHVVPVVGLLRPPLDLTPDSFEVAEIFEVPLPFIMDPANHQRRFRLTEQGEQRFYTAMTYQHRTIWGATAAMLVNLYDVLAELWTS